MKRLFLILLIFNFPLELVRLLSSAGQEFSIFNSASAQRTPLEKYEIAPAPFEHVYIDHVRLNPSRTVTIGDNQYLGQVNRDHQFYGYGMFVNGDGSTITGKFRDSELLFGITMTQTAAVVGNIKNSSVVIAIGVAEVLTGASIPAARTYSFLESYVAAGLIYWALATAAEQLIGQWEIRPEARQSSWFWQVCARVRRRRTVTVAQQEKRGQVHAELEAYQKIL